MDNGRTEQKVLKVVADQMGLRLEEVTPKSLLMSDLGADSLDEIELIMALEEEFRIELADDVFRVDHDEIDYTVEHVINVVQKYI